jgi:hypothetical protein
MSAERMIDAASAITALYSGNAAACDCMMARRKLQNQHAAAFAQLEKHHARARDVLGRHTARMTAASLQAKALCGSNAAACVPVMVLCCCRIKEVKCFRATRVYLKAVTPHGLRYIWLVRA